MLDNGERQVAPVLSGIRRDHLARYRWAAAQLAPRSRVLDLACGVGYGAWILAGAHHDVVAVDNDAEAIAYGKRHYAHERISYRCQDAAASLDGEFDAVTCFETIEHLADPLPMLMALADKAPVLLASVPNEEKFPYRNYKFHHRHYTRRQFVELLAKAGYEASDMYGQAGPLSDVELSCNGRTIIVCARRTTDSDTPRLSSPSAAVAPVPAHVVILGLGPSLRDYVDLAKRLGGRYRFADEVWGINAVGGVLQCDRLWHMDDVRLQEIRAAANPDGNIAAMLEWMHRHPGPIYTSRVHQDYPGLVAFPLEDVINDCGYAYFNSTAAYAIAYAIHIGVKKMSLFGYDFTYPNAHHAEKGRACVEFWLGIAAARGISLAVAETSTLMDARERPDEKLYGYDSVAVTITQEAGGMGRVKMEPRETLPTAAEIESRYDHAQHPAKDLVEAN